MPLSAGSRLGPYEIVSQLGAGGMGEVWKAKDTRIGRDVAVKVLPAQFSSNEEFKVRFEREARAISQLNHPNICTLFDVGENYLVMELLDGETLAARIEKGPLPLSDVTRYAIQIAGALDRAHRSGIVHRDLKPGNVVLTKTGAKLLDFGLAKMDSRATVSTDGATEQRAALTQEGTILGTYQYMSPEQLAGEEVDSRSDIFSFGALLYEMLTGQRAFQGKNKASLIRAIVSGEPPSVSSIQPTTPPALDHLIRKCLEKDPDERLQSAHDIAEELRWISEVGSQAGTAAVVTMRRRVRERLAWGVAAAFAIALVAVLALGVPRYIAQRTRASRVLRFEIPIPPGTDPSTYDWQGIALSPDGTRAALSLNGADGARHLWVRAFDSIRATVLADTNDASYPFWSPDSRYIAFFADGKLKKVDAGGGPVQVICDAPSGRGGTWSSDGTILLSPNIYSAIYKVHNGGGTPVAVTKIDRSSEQTQRWPSFLPDGRHFLYVSRSTRTNENGRSARGRVMLTSLDSPGASLLIEDGSNARYLAPGWLLFARADSLMAVRFNLRTLHVEGDPFAVPVDKVSFWEAKNLSLYSISEDGSLLYLPEQSRTSEIRWMGRNGFPLEVEVPAGIYADLSLSPDGKRLAFIKQDQTTPDKADIWLHDIGTANTSRLTFEGDYLHAIWSPDGTKLYCVVNKKGAGDLYEKSVIGGEEARPLYESPDYKVTVTPTPDNKYLIFTEQHAETNEDLYTFSLADRKVTPFLVTPAIESLPAISPDGKWLAFVSTESGQGQVYVRHFPDSGEQFQISTAGGSWPRWSPDGRELYYVAPDASTMRSVIDEKSGFSAAPPQLLFKTAGGELSRSSLWREPSRDAQKFLGIIPITASRATTYHVVINLPELLGAVK